MKVCQCYLSRVRYYNSLKDAYYIAKVFKFTSSSSAGLFIADLRGQSLLKIFLIYGL